VIQDGAVLIRDGILVEVGPSRRVENLAQARGAIEINAAGRVVMPGFIDAHTHLAFPPAGIHAEDSSAAVRAVHTATRQRLEIRTRAYIDAMARHGTTRSRPGADWMRAPKPNCCGCLARCATNRWS
jgi:imidazolonepropionase